MKQLQDRLRVASFRSDDIRSCSLGHCRRATTEKPITRGWERNVFHRVSNGLKELSFPPSKGVEKRLVGTGR